MQNLAGLVASASSANVQAVIDSHVEVFKEELELVNGVTAMIHVDPEVQPCFYTTRMVPYALKAKVDQELERLEHAKIIEPMQYSDWAAPIVPVLKRDESVRICGDHKVIVNRASKL